MDILISFARGFFIFLAIYWLLKPIYDLLRRIADRLEELPFGELIHVLKNPPVTSVEIDGLADLEKALRDLAANQGGKLSDDERKALTDEFNQRLIERTQGFLRQAAKERRAV